MIAYIQFGPGHCDAVLPKDKTPSTKMDLCKCTFGKNGVILCVNPQHYLICNILVIFNNKITDYKIRLL